MLIPILEILILFCLLIITYHFLGYPLLLYILSLFNEFSSFENKKESLPSVSMIVPVYNEGEIIEDKLKNISEFTYNGKFECIIVSDSTDNTNEIIKKNNLSSVSLINLKERKGKSYAINKALKRAKNDILVFSDANTMYSSDAISNLVRPFSDKSIGCVTGNLKINSINSSDSEGVYWKYELCLRKLENKLGTTVSINGGILAVRKSEFRSLPKNAVTDDFVTAMYQAEKGKRIYFCEDALAFEKATGSLWNEFYRRVRIGVGNFQSLFWFYNLLNPKYKLLSLELFSHKILRWIMPGIISILFISTTILFILEPSILSLLLFFVQSFGYSLGLVGILSPKIRNLSVLFRIPAFFVLMNIAFVLGFINFLLGKDIDIWKKTPRQ